MVLKLFLACQQILAIFDLRYLDVGTSRALQIVESCIPGFGEHVLKFGEHENDEKHQPDELKHSIYDSKHTIYDSKHSICQPVDSKHTFLQHFCKMTIVNL